MPDSGDLILYLLSSIAFSSIYSCFQIRLLKKDTELIILYIILWLFYLFGTIIKSFIFYDIDVNLISLFYEYNIKDFVPSSHEVIYFGLLLNSIYFCVFNYAFLACSIKFKQSIYFNGHENSNRASNTSKAFILLSSTFSLISLFGLVFNIGLENIANHFSAKRFNDSFSLATYIFFKTSSFSRIFYLFGRLRLNPMSLLGFPFLALQSSVILISSVITSNRSYLLLFLLEALMMEFMSLKGQRKTNKKLVKLSSSNNNNYKIIILSVIVFLFFVLLLITALRTSSSNNSLSLFDIIHISFLKILSGRYLFDVIKLGEIYNFSISTYKDVTFYSLGWLAPFLIPNHKDIGKNIAIEVFGYTNLIGGITPGLFGELAYDFGILWGGILLPVFCFFYWAISTKMSYLITRSALPIYWIILLSKSVLVLNSSFSACLFSLLFDVIGILLSTLMIKFKLRNST